MDQPMTLDYRLLVDNLTTAILLVDRNLNIFYLNSSCEALFDISTLRAVGQPVLNLMHMPNDEFNTHEALLNIKWNWIDAYKEKYTPTYLKCWYKSAVKWKN